ncbi:organic hydroperoxide reductase OsmC/OhrA [Sinorhizobium fredii]
MTEIEKVLYTGKTRTTGGREGASRSSDGHLDIKLSSPGSSRPGTNPEQLFAAGWSACFIGAIGKAASERKITLRPIWRWMRKWICATAQAPIRCRPGSM